MKMVFNTLSQHDILISLSVGFCLSLIYLYLLWQTIQIVKKSNHPILILFISGATRIFLLVFTALLFSKENLSRFLLIFCAFFLTRVIILKLLKPSLKIEVKENEFAYHKNESESLKTGLKKDKKAKTQKKRNTKK